MRRADRLRLEAAERELVRLRSHLTFIGARCRGMAPGLASQALRSEVWPSWPTNSKHYRDGKGRT